MSRYHRECWGNCELERCLGGSGCTGAYGTGQDSCKILQQNGVDVWHRVLSNGASSEKLAWWLRGTYDRQLGWIPNDAAFAALQEDGDLYQLGLGSSATEVKSFISVPEVRRIPLPSRDALCELTVSPAFPDGSVSSEGTTALRCGTQSQSTFAARTQATRFI